VLSKAGVGSRTEARSWIHAGRVSINGPTIENPDHGIDPQRDRIRFDGRPLKARERVYVLLYKPTGYLTTYRDPQGRPTVYDLIEDVGTFVSPVGRLDLDTSGLLLMTNDTQLAEWIADPVNDLPRVYIATVRGRFGEGERAQAVRGIKIGGEHLNAHTIDILKSSSRESHLSIELREGKNREVRRLLSGIGHEVTRLKRVKFGGLEIGDLEPGQWRQLSREELTRALR